MEIMTIEIYEEENENFDLSEVETINATETTQGKSGGAIMEVSSWVYMY